MRKFNKDLKIITIIVSIVFLCNASLYSSPASKDLLRVPIGNTASRLSMVMRIYAAFKRIPELVWENLKISYLTAAFGVPGAIEGASEAREAMEAKFNSSKERSDAWIKVVFLAISQYVDKNELPREDLEVFLKKIIVKICQLSKNIGEFESACDHLYFFNEILAINNKSQERFTRFTLSRIVSNVMDIKEFNLFMKAGIKLVTNGKNIDELIEITKYDHAKRVLYLNNLLVGAVSLDKKIPARGASSKCI
jgi:hypothetical protein